MMLVLLPSAFMRVLLVLVWTLCLGVQLKAQETTARLPLNVLTFNLRYNNPEDGPNAWPHRKEMVAKVFTDHDVDLAGLQEALSGMIDDLQGLLPGYAFIGVGREDGQKKGEFAPIFYRKDRFTLEKQGTFWLSETPETVGSKGWDAALARIATWGIFRGNASGKEFLFMNTHFDHRGETARRESAKLLIARAAALSEGKLPVVLTGDFNTTPDSTAIQTVTSDSRLKLTDSTDVSQTPHIGGTMTFNGFGREKSGDIIDYIFVGPGVKVESHGYFPEIQDGVYVSDHWPVVSRVLLP